MSILIDKSQARKTGGNKEMVLVWTERNGNNYIMMMSEIRELPACRNQKIIRFFLYAFLYVFFIYNSVYFTQTYTSTSFTSCWMKVFKSHFESISLVLTERGNSVIFYFSILQENNENFFFLVHSGKSTILANIFQTNGSFSMK